MPQLITNTTRATVGERLFSKFTAAVEVCTSVIRSARTTIYMMKPFVGCDNVPAMVKCYLAQSTLCLLTPRDSSRVNRHSCVESDVPLRTCTFPSSQDIPTDNASLLPTRSHETQNISRCPAPPYLSKDLPDNHDYLYGRGREYLRKEFAPRRPFPYPEFPRSLPLLIATAIHLHHRHEVRQYDDHHTHENHRRHYHKHHCRSQALSGALVATISEGRPVVFRTHRAVCKGNRGRSFTPSRTHRASVREGTDTGFDRGVPSPQ